MSGDKHERKFQKFFRLVFPAHIHTFIFSLLTLYFLSFSFSYLYPFSLSLHLLFLTLLAILHVVILTVAFPCSSTFFFSVLYFIFLHILLLFLLYRSFPCLFHFSAAPLALISSSPCSSGENMLWPVFGFQWWWAWPMGERSKIGTFEIYTYYCC